MNSKELIDEYRDYCENHVAQTLLNIWQVEDDKTAPVCKNCRYFGESSLYVGEGFCTRSSDRKKWVEHKSYDLKCEHFLKRG